MPREQPNPGENDISYPFKDYHLILEKATTKEELKQSLEELLRIAKEKVHIFSLDGVRGSGKTTLQLEIAKILRTEGYRVLLTKFGGFVDDSEIDIFQQNGLRFNPEILKELKVLNIMKSNYGANQDGQISLESLEDQLNNFWDDPITKVDILNLYKTKLSKVNELGEESWHLLQKQFIETLLTSEPGVVILGTRGPLNRLISWNNHRKTGRYSQPFQTDFKLSDLATAIHVPRPELTVALITDTLSLQKRISMDLSRQDVQVRQASVERNNNNFNRLAIEMTFSQPSEYAIVVTDKNIDDAASVIAGQFNNRMQNKILRI